MPLSIKVNLRVTGHCNQGGRKYMEDMFSVAYQQTSDEKDIEYAFFGIFDGHGGDEAAIFAKDHLMDIIVKQKNFWSDKDEDVLRAIRDGYVNTHYAMWRELEKWPRTASGLPSTAGTTASIAFIRRGKIYVGHVGDSGIVLGYQEDDDPQWKARPLTRDHKPESLPEMNRIHESGGKVVCKSGVPRVVWNRPRIGHKGPVRRSTHIDEIPFLAVARSLGDLWSYNSELDTFVVSPEPDVHVFTIDSKAYKCLIFGTDGLWNMLTPQYAVDIVQAAEEHNEKHFIASQQTGSEADTQQWINPSKSLVDKALERWESTRLRADNTSVITLMLDPPATRNDMQFPKKKDLMSSMTDLPVASVIGTPLEMPPPDLPPWNRVNPFQETFARRNTELYTAKDDKLILDIPEMGKLFYNLESSELLKTSMMDVGMSESVDNVTRNHAKHYSPVENTDDVDLDVTPDLPQSPENTTENIQVAEISSSDTPSLKLPPETKREPSSEEKPDSPSKDMRVPIVRKPTINAPQLQKMLLTTKKTETFKITRQNAFSGSCDELKSMPRLRRSQFNIQSYKEVTTRRRTHTSGITGVIDKRASLMVNRNEVRNTRRRETSTPHVMPATSSVDDKVAHYLREESSGKRRHSSTFEKAEQEAYSVQEPCSKRRTRSEDRRCPGDENSPANQEAKGQSSRVRWPSSCSKSRNSTPGTSKDEKPQNYQRRSLEKKATPVKTIRRPSINGSSRVLRGSFALREWDQSKAPRRSSFSRTPEASSSSSSSNNSNSSTPQMWLRSDTIAATPIKTLRSRNVDIQGHTVPPQVAHQYGIVKQKGSNKIKLTNGKKMKQSTQIGSSAPGPSGISKRVKSVSPYNPGARSLNTRSRLKRLGK